MDLSLVVTEIYPHAIPSEHFSISENENGQYINDWFLNESLPTQEEIEDAWFRVVKKEKIKNLEEECTQKIISGFISDSTGFEFEFETHDQNNFTQQAIILMSNEALLDVVWKTKSHGVQTLSREQFFIILKESEIHKRNAIGKYWALKAEAEKATTEEELNQLVWG